MIELKPGAVIETLHKLRAEVAFSKRGDEDRDDQLYIESVIARFLSRFSNTHDETLSVDFLWVVSELLYDAVGECRT